MKDRIPTLPGRVKLTMPDGSVQYVTMEMADEPTQLGTPLTKANFMTDATATVLGLTSDNPTVNEALALLAGLLTKVIPISQGGTGQTTAPAAMNALINGLTALASTDLADGDLLPLKDVSANTGKKVTLANLSSFISGKIPIPTSFLAATCDNIAVSSGSAGTYLNKTLNFTPKFVVYFYGNGIHISDGSKTFLLHENSSGDLQEQILSYNPILFSENTIRFRRALNGTINYFYLAVGDEGVSGANLQALNQSLTEGELTMIEQGQNQTDQELRLLAVEKKLEEISSGGGGATYPVTLDIPVGFRVVGVTVA